MMRNRQAPHIDFRDLNGLMGKIVPSNVDMMIERKGYFLVGEWKREGESISIGQEILLKRLAAVPKFVVLIIQGHTTDSVMVVDEFSYMDRNGKLTALGDTVDKFKQFLVHWKKTAEDYSEREQHEGVHQ